MSAGREQRVGAVVAAVARQALADRGLGRIALLDDGSPEAELAARLLAPLGADAVLRVADAGPELEPLLHRAAGDLDSERVAEELRRCRARLTRDALPAHPANRTALLLGGPLPPEPLLPLGDLLASEVAELAGGWSAPAEVRRLAEQAGGIARLDEALRQRLDRRDPEGLARLPAEARDAVEAALALGAASRLWPHVVPKLGHRTLGADLFQ